jgi:hypothetical protein
MLISRKKKLKAMISSDLVCLSALRRRQYGYRMSGDGVVNVKTLPEEAKPENLATGTCMGGDRTISIAEPRNARIHVITCNVHRQ